MSDGAEPRVSLLPSGDAGADGARSSSYGPAILELAMELGPRMPMPTVDFSMLLRPGKKDEGGADWLVAAVAKAGPAKEQRGQLPPGVDKDIASLQGDGDPRQGDARTGERATSSTEVSKGSKAELERVAQNASEALVFATVPLPSRPVGVGAQWIAETRMPLSGLDVLAYRAYRVKSIDGDRLHLTVEVKAYAAGHDANIQGVPKGATFEQFDTESQGELELVRGESLARKLELQQRVVMIFAGPGGAQPPQQPGQPPGNMLTAQISEPGDAHTRGGSARGDEGTLTVRCSAARLRSTREEEVAGVAWARGRIAPGPASARWKAGGKRAFECTLPGRVGRT